MNCICQWEFFFEERKKIGTQSSKLKLRFGLTAYVLEKYDYNKSTIFLFTLSQNYNSNAMYHNFKI